ncbi:MAG: hypothetical protein O3C51_00295 [Planctomycetota bacterium]|nr:hypothetical protein [Planctomycetota bacterium]
MPRALDELLVLLARHHDVDPPAIGPSSHGLSGDTPLLAHEHPGRRDRLEARLAGDRDEPAPRLLAELRAFGGPSLRWTLWKDSAAALSAVIASARATTGRDATVVCSPSWAAAEYGPARPLEDAIAACGADAPACVVVEPRLSPDDWARIAGAAREAGAILVADETRTAGRLADALCASGLQPSPDAILVGESLAAGASFAALAQTGDAPETNRVDDPSPSPVALELALATVAEIRSAPVATELAARGAALSRCFEDTCREHDIRARLVGPEALPSLRFDGQENAEAPLIAHHFLLELKALGVSADAYPAFSAGAADAEEARIDAALADAIARIRTLLIEHNSYLSGGIPFVFPDNDPRLADRGIARYRHPKLAEVDIEPVDGEPAMRIAFAAGQLGPITSSGFYLPTRLRGDFTIEVRYDVRTWEPGPDSACLGLFVQNEPSTARYYAQLMSTADRIGEISAAAGLEGELTGRHPIPGRAGFLKLTRVGDSLTTWHRDVDAADWTALGTKSPCSTDDVITGAKIWSKVRCGGLVVDLSAMRVEATIPDDQIPRLEPRPDPRQGG